ncbi:type II toxin-antitoxin system HicA family toxin [Rugamonas rubra]|uniref:type II toxin-antitoxin system HicA family toxin n=1 Tax=Rugamonas rubra TaxID=758825 RepID=UPI000B83CA86
MNGYYKLVIELLKKHGYVYLRQGKGSHEIWCKGSHHQIVPFNCASRHTANGIMRDCQINHRF